MSDRLVSHILSGVHRIDVVWKFSDLMPVSWKLFPLTWFLKCSVCEKNQRGLIQEASKFWSGSVIILFLCCSLAALFCMYKNW